MHPSNGMTGSLPGFFEGTEMPAAGWWEALWPDPAGVLVAMGVTSGMDVIDLCSGDGWLTLQLTRIASHVIAIDIDTGLLDVALRTRPFGFETRRLSVYGECLSWRTEPAATCARCA
jgi:predicted methyltransferase